MFLKMHLCTTVTFRSNCFIVITILLGGFLACIPTAVFSISGNKVEILDTSYPILISEKYVVKQSKSTANLSDLLPNSYFGYSVSLAKGSTMPKDPHGWVFIGAPKSNTSDVNKYDKEKENEPGVMWRCRLKKFSEKELDCEMMNIDPPLENRNDGQLAIKSGNPVHESHSGAFIGVASEINHNRFVTCGMNWNRGNAAIYYNGICYWFQDVEDSGNSYRRNDLTQLVDKSHLDHRLMPLLQLNNNSEAQFEYTPHGRTNVRQKVPEWRYGQVGLSVHLFLDVESKSKDANLLIGAPGVRNWAGAVILYTNTYQPKEQMQRLNRNKDNPTFSEYVVLNRGKQPKPQQSENNTELWDEYFGYSVSSGKYLQKDKILYAAGAPRASHCGTVVIFDYPKSASRIKRPIIIHRNIDAPSKRSFGSYFGSVLHSVDYDEDEDGLDELIVGAPLYTIPNSKIGDQGRVFVYRLKNTQRDSAINPVQELVGSRSPRARFGSAITSLKMEPTKVYLVIGAPFEDDGKAVGAIYLYLYNKKAGKFDVPFAQRVHASRISESLNGFGSSLSIPQDIDMNDTPDMAIGAFKSGHTVVLRTRPRMHINSWMEFYSVGKSSIDKVQRGEKKFFLKSCSKFVKILGLSQNTFEISVTIRSFDARIKFEKDDNNKQPCNPEDKITFNQNIGQREACKDFGVVSCQEHGFGTDTSDYESNSVISFDFSQEVRYDGTLNHSLSVFNIYAEKPSSKLPNQDSTLASFQERLPAPYKSTLEKEIYMSPSDCPDTCNVNLEISWSFFHPLARDHKMSKIQIMESQEIIMQLIIVNTGETAVKQNISFVWDPLWITESTSGDRWLQQHKCKKSNDSESRIFHDCILPSNIKKGQNITIPIHLKMEEFYTSEPKDLTFIVQATVHFSDKDIPLHTPSKAELLLISPPTLATIRGLKLADEKILRGANSYYVSKLPNGVKDDGKPVQEYDRTTQILYDSIRMRFTILVNGASVNETVATFKIPVSLNGKQMFVVKQPEDYFCHSTSSKYSFSKIKIIPPGSSADIPPGGRSGNQDPSDPNQDFTMDDHVEESTRQRRDVPNSQVTVDDTNPTEVTKTAAGKEPQIAIESPLPTPPARHEKIAPPSDALKFMCTSSETDCLEVSCTLKNVRADVDVPITFEMFPIKEAVDGLLKSNAKSALFIEATGSVDIVPLAKVRHAHYHDDDTSELVLVKIISKKVEAWVYAVALGGGILFLILIVFALFKCGFFKREKLEELNHMKAEHHRKSMLAAARASMMVMQSSATVATSPDGGSQSKENLTEAEVHNEDTPPTKSKHVEFATPSFKELEAKDDL